MEKHKKKAPNARADAFFLAGIIGMLIAIFGVLFMQSGSLTQRMVFSLAVIILLIVAIDSKQKVLEAAEIVVFIGIVLALLTVNETITIILIAVSVIILVTYLFWVGYYRAEPIGLIGTAGFILLALGYAVNTGDAKLLNSFAFGFGGIVAALYSLLALLFYKVRVQAIWFILNLAFAVGPLFFFFTNILF